MRWSDVPEFERLPISALVRRNVENADSIAAAMVAMARRDEWKAADRTTRLELLREVIRPFDPQADQRGEFVQ